MADDEQPLLGDSAADSPATVPQVGTLDVDLVIGKLLGYKNNPGKQVWSMMSADCVDWAIDTRFFPYIVSSIYDWALFPARKVLIK